MQIALASTSHTAAQARATVRSAFAAAPTSMLYVLDLDGTYLPLSDEKVLTPPDLGLDAREQHIRAVLLDPGGLARWSLPSLLRRALQTGPTVLALGPGVLLLRDPSELTDLAAQDQVCLIARSAEILPQDGAWPGPADLFAAGSYHPHLVAVSQAASDFLDLWERLAADPHTASDRWLDFAASHLRHRTVSAARFLVSAWTGPSARVAENAEGALEVDGVPAVALDLTGLDPDAPWLLDPDTHRPPRIRLSAHPALARLAARYASEVRDEASVRKSTVESPVTSVGLAMHDHLRTTFRAALDESPSRSIDALPDPFDPEHSEQLTAWLLQPDERGGDLGLGRYLASIYQSRADLRTVFPGVPGEHWEAFLRWADRDGRHEPAYSADLIALALAVVGDAGPTTPSGIAEYSARPAGMNVTGYLRGELGIGESARLILGALSAAGIPFATVSVDRNLQSRQGARYQASAADGPFDTTLLCVNADMTPTVSAAVPSLLGGSYNIGMWYWEVQDFPPSQHQGFSHLDEVWVATDFVRQAVEPHSPLPVRTITPPLPQPHHTTGRSRADLGLPERPIFLFAFDYLSTVERKNPWGLVEAFETAFSPGEGPLLVIKSINAERRVGQAERLRLRVAGSPDVLLLEDYLDPDDQDALMEVCDCYVSLHRSEGLGLTMAEAMAWGKPVIATGYSGNMQFMNDANSFLVPWTPTEIPAGCEPYLSGGMWAEPDLQAAARLMRTVLEDAELAKARGRQGADDLRLLHSPEVAGRRVSARLAELVPQRRARQRPPT